MGSERVEIVRRLYESFRERDNDAAFALMDPDVVWVSNEFVAPGIDHAYHGHEGVRRFWRQWLEAWEELDWRIETIEEIADCRVRVVIRQRNKGRGTGIWVDQPPYEQVWTLADGKVIRVDYHALD